ncbi:MAG: ABC transporter permease [Candidatus Natronoplasma sp.]
MKLRYYIIRRLILAVVVLFGVTIIAFVLTRLVPANPVHMWVGPRATPEQIVAAEKELGLNQPILIQYFGYMGDLLQGNLGTSIRTHNPVLEDITHFLPASLEIILLGMFIAVVLGVPLGLYSAAKRNTWVDHAARLFSVTGVSLPTFWLAMILQLIFFQQLGLLPSSGRISLQIQQAYPFESITGFILIDTLLQGNLIAFQDAAKHIILPALTMAAYPLGLVTRQVRSATIDVLNEDYIRMERAFGIKESKILFVYTLRNSFGSTLNVLALTFAYSLVSIFLIESIFSWPGLGTYAATSISVMDYPAIMGIVILVAVIYVFLNLAVDVIQAYMDPRIRFD